MDEKELFFRLIYAFLNSLNIASSFFPTKLKPINGIISDSKSNLSAKLILRIK